MAKSPIFSMFGRSPLRPLQAHINEVHHCAATLLPFIEAVLEQNWPQAEKQQALISAGEKKADKLKKDLRLHLPSGLFLPVSRSDILELLSAQDRIANKAKDIAGLVVGRKMQIPEPFANNYLTFFKRCIEASKHAVKAINELDELLEAGFRGNEVKLVKDMIVKLDKIEHDTDDMQIDIRKQLFLLEDQLSPINVIFLYKMIEWTGDLADHSQTVGGKLQ